jgi:hypothetical protein
MTLTFPSARDFTIPPVVTPSIYDSLTTICRKLGHLLAIAGLTLSCWKPSSKRLVDLFPSWLVAGLVAWSVSSQESLINCLRVTRYSSSHAFESTPLLCLWMMWELKATDQIMMLWRIRVLSPRASGLKLSHLQHGTISIEAKEWARSTTSLAEERFVLNVI